MGAVDDAVGALWGKTAESGGYHPLYCHMLDVGSVARTLLEHPGAGHYVDLFARLLGAAPGLVPRLVPFLVALHDLGKASPSFQAKSPPHWARVQAAGFTASPIPIASFSHGLESHLVLAETLSRLHLLDLPDGTPRLRERRTLRVLALGVGAHHGLFFADGCSRAYPEVPAEEDPDEPWREPWRQARLALVEQMRRVFYGPPEPVTVSPSNLSGLCVALDGITILCDWIGSDTTCFPPYEGPLAAYPEESRSRADEALGARRILDYLPRSACPTTFASLFPSRRPRPLQAALDPDALPTIPERALVVVEAPTGEGKTEAALLVAARLAERPSCRGFYFALPTVATSSQMYTRVRDFLASRLSREGLAGERAALILVNGQAELSEELERAIETARHPSAGEEDEPVVADTWLLPRKRSLLSPYGVGTVDQAMLGALNVRHVALRLLGLAGKVVIVDEVHAYDLYMSTILDRLLEWLRVLGASVVLLSATLPRARREKLIAAYSGGGVDRIGERASAGLDPYPLVTIADAASPSATVARLTPRAASPDRRVQVERRPGGEEAREENARFLLGEVRSGGSVCWLLNTVREAQASYLALEALIARLPAGERPDLLLFHARYPLGRRKEIETAVLDRLGPTGDRRRPLILVATQVVEQSLDLDFDLLMTELSPVDLLLQRAGRLHRHAHHDRERPANLARPRLVLLEPRAGQAGRPELGPSGLIYAPFVLLKTILVLHGRETIAIPGDVRALVETVYDDAPPPRETALRAGLDPEHLIEARTLLERDRAREEQSAVRHLLGSPDVEGRFYVNPTLELDDGALERDAWVAAQTRLADPSVRVVLLEADDPLVEVLRRADRRLSPEEAREALRHSVSLPNRRLVEHVSRAQADPRVVSLDDHRGLAGHHLIVLERGAYVWTDEGHSYRLAVSDELGVTIEREE